MCRRVYFNFKIIFILTIFAVITQQSPGQLSVAQRARPFRLTDIFHSVRLSDMRGRFTIRRKSAVLCRSISLFFFRLCNKEEIGVIVIAYCQCNGSRKLRTSMKKWKQRNPLKNVSTLFWKLETMCFYHLCSWCSRRNIKYFLREVKRVK